MVIILEDLVGKKFSHLKIESAYRDDKSRIQCNVLCDCGKHSTCLYSNLKSGKTKSCGHLEQQNRKKFINMLGESFGCLTVIEKTNMRKEGCIVWLCKCSCGEKVYASQRQLVRGYVTQCPNHKKRILTGKKFGYLTVETFSKAVDSLLCKCDCGIYTWVERGNLLNGHTRSFGHLQFQDNLPRIDGIVPSALRGKKSIANTSGIVGVSQTKNDKWVSYITFKGKRYTLGVFEDIENAEAHRKNAERKFFDPYLLMERNLKINKGGRKWKIIIKLVEEISFIIFFTFPIVDLN